MKENAEQLIALSDEMDFDSWMITGKYHAGEALAMMGEPHEGLSAMHDAVAVWQSLGVRCYSTGVLAGLSRAQGEAGRTEAALTTLAEALALLNETEERFYEAEIHRLRGKLLLHQGRAAEAEASLQKAIDVARRQQARSWELRATMSLCRLWEKQGRIGEARDRLAEIYAWFTEGFDTPDLVEARSLLEALGGP